MTNKMTISEFLLARIAEDENLARAATPGPWKWWNLEGVDQGWSDNGPNLETVTDEWEVCTYFCTWKEPDDNHRGEMGKPGHEHRNSETVISSWGHDANGINIERADAEFIVGHDPSRVLAECAAKRVMVSGWQGMVVEHRRAFKLDPPLSPVIAAFAAVYKDHPDYRQEWELNRNDGAR